MPFAAARPWVMSRIISIHHLTNMTLNSQMAHDVHASRGQVLIETPTLMNDVLDGMSIYVKSHEPIAF